MARDIIYDPFGQAYRLKDKRKQNELIRTKGFTKERREIPAQLLQSKKVAATPSPKRETYSIKMNYAAKTELTKIPGVGVNKAQKIIDNRPLESNGDLLDAVGSITVKGLEVEGKDLVLDYSYDLEDFDNVSE